MSVDQIIVLAFPVFALLIGAEFVYGWVIKRNTYRLNDAISSLSQGLISQITAVFTQFCQVGLYTLVYSAVAVYHPHGFWSAWYGWLLAIICFDFCDYWLHRASHESAILWAAHVVHHQSQDFNFSTALRQESAYMLLGCIFYLPMALLGIPPDDYAVAGLVVLLYQFWIHTEHVGKLGWMDRVFSTPSNHRVHHAVNPEYLDRNYGAILVLWDRLFGSFAEEKAPCVYGTVPPLNSWNPLWAIAATYCKLARLSWQAPRWRDKLLVWFRHPGWRPEGLPPVASRTPARRAVYHPPMRRAAGWMAFVLFVLLTIATGMFLWQADTLSSRLSGFSAILILAGLWAVGALLQGHPRPAA